jgi:hypothetical protein
MAKNYYLPRDDSGKAQLLEHLARRLPAYAETLEVSAADIASLQADAEAFRHAIASTDSIQANARQWTAYKNLQRDGGVRVEPAAPIAPPARAGAGRRSGHRAAADRPRLPPQDGPPVQRGDRPRPPDHRPRAARHPDDWKPVLDTRSVAGQPVIKWPKGDADAIEIWADRDDGQGFRLATITSGTDYTDTTTPPPARSGNTRPSTASATPRSASGAAW